jgi:uncharacterized membrane protein YhaH (DUF805 family)
MIQGTYWLTLLVDPRGRIGRSGLLISASLMLAVEFLLLTLTPDPASGLPTYLWPLKALELWVGMAALIKRLHDVGRSGWWVLGGMAGICVWSAVVAIVFVFALGGQAFQPGSAGYAMLLGILMLPALGMAFWLHLAPGDPVTNHYGAPQSLPGKLANGESAVDAPSRSPANTSTA